MSRTSHHVGMVGEGRFIAWAASRGWDVFRGLDGHAPCDFVVDMDGVLARVEVKRIEAVQVSEGSNYYCTVTKLDRNRFDFLYASTPDGDYWIPVAECPERTLAIKQPGEYRRRITKPGKYEVFRVS